MFSILWIISTAQFVRALHVDLLPVCEEPYGHVMHTLDLSQASSGVLNCAMLCRNLPQCTSILVNHVAGHCKLNRDEQTSWTTCPSPNSVYASVPVGSTMGLACYTNDDCADIQSDCRDGVCGCLPGLTFDSSISSCVGSCPGGYGHTFQSDFGYGIQASYDRYIPGLTEQACLQACLDETTFVCRHVQYWTYYNECYLYSEENISVEYIDPSYYYYSYYYYYDYDERNLYHRHCA